ncbi:hypothetical protein ABT215_11160 [Streptomyces sp900105755]|uniref:hypothetical protein n=1 Tax=Streptomyces sp. 900105755 TaxID=3154389 RepID=UPI003330CFF2
MASRNETDAVVTAAATVQSPEGPQCPQEAPEEARTSNSPDSTPEAATEELSGLPEASGAARLPADRETEIRKHVADTTNWSLGNLAARDLLTELDRVRAERDQFADRVDTLTAVAKGNKRHVQSMFVEVQKAQRERDEARAATAVSGRVDTLRWAADWFEADGRYVTRTFGHQAAALLRRLADEEPQQDAAEAHPAEHKWAAELYDPAADEWVPGTRYLVRDRAVNALEHGRRIGPTWKDGTPTQRRLVRATTTYTVEEPRS